MLLCINGYSSPLSIFIGEAAKNVSKSIEVIGIWRRTSKSDEGTHILNQEDVRLTEILQAKKDSHKIKILVNVASQVPSSNQGDLNYYTSNCIEIPNTLENIIDVGSFTHVVNISTVDIFSHSDDQISKYSVPNPSNHYGRSKLILENLVERLAIKRHLNFLCLRIPVLLVPNVKNNFIANWIDMLYEGKSVYFSNKCGTFNNIADARLVWDLILEFSKNSNNISQKLNLCSYDSVTLNELTKIVAKCMGVQHDLFIEVEAKKKPQLIVSEIYENYGLPKRTVLDSISWFVERRKEVLNGEF